MLKRRCINSYLYLMGVLDVETHATPVKRNTDDSELKQYLDRIDSLGLSARSFNSLDRSGIQYVA